MDNEDFLVKKINDIRHDKTKGLAEDKLISFFLMHQTQVLIYLSRIHFSLKKNSIFVGKTVN